MHFVKIGVFRDFYRDDNPDGAPDMEAVEAFEAYEQALLAFHFDRVSRMRGIKPEPGAVDHHFDPASVKPIKFVQRILGGTIGTVQVPDEKHIARFQAFRHFLIDGTGRTDRRKSLDMDFVTNCRQSINLPVGALFGGRHTNVCNLFHSIQ